VSKRALSRLYHSQIGLFTYAAAVLPCCSSEGGSSEDTSYGTSSVCLTVVAAVVGLALVVVINDWR